MYYRAVLVNYRICNILGENLTILKLKRTHYSGRLFAR